jgi:hypothetical protein
MTPTSRASSLFERFFLPLYPPDVRRDLARARTTDVNPANNSRLLAQVDDIARTFAELAPALLERDIDLDFSDASVHRLAAALSKDTRDRLTTPVARTDEVPPIVQLVTHGAIYVGACIVRNHGGTWQLRNPLWESLVRLESRAGVGDLAVFQWWLKALSDDEIGEPRLGDRYRLHVELPTARPETLPVIAETGRRIPRLTKVRYDALHRHLRAHVPELREVGEHFPSAERFAELGFHWLDFDLVGGGRMLLSHGPTDAGVHLIWLDASGFAASAFLPADALPEHRLEQSGDTLAVIVPVLGREQRHEMLWWGPAG